MRLMVEFSQILFSVPFAVFHSLEIIYIKTLEKDSKEYIINNILNFSLNVLLTKNVQPTKNFINRDGLRTGRKINIGKVETHYE